MTPLARITAVLILVAAVANTACLALAAEPKPAPVRTVGPAQALAVQQQADLAAKRAATAAATVTLPPVEAPAQLVAARRAPLALPAVRIRHLPQISEALGSIPREEWIRRALGKGPDVTVSIPASAAPANGGPR